MTLTLIQRTVVLHVIIGEDGKALEVSYVRGPEKFKAAAIQAVKQRQLDQQTFFGRPAKLDTRIKVVAPQ